MHGIWEEFLTIVKQEAGSHIVETWFKAVSFEQWEARTNTAVLMMPNIFVSNWIQKHYITLIKTHLSRLLHTTSIKIFFTCKNDNDSYKHTIRPASLIPNKSFIALEKSDISLVKSTQSAPLTTIEKKSTSLTQLPRKTTRLETTKLNERYTFNTFVVGPTNELAHAAAITVSHNIGKVYNPLFIYGGTGLGKTHLLHAIGNELKSTNPEATICYATSDTFVNEFINAIKSDKTRNFREKYQKVDLLLLDDIQFFSHKEQTQETFFHIFDALHGRQKQVVFSSDTLPQNILGLQGRLQSRLQCGLVADVQMPTLEMKIAILKKKAQAQGLTLEHDILRSIAEQPAKSIRELEGYLMRLAAFSAISHQPINIDTIKKIIVNTHQQRPQTITIDAIIKSVARHFNIAIADIKSKQRTKQIVLCRQIACYLMKKHTPHSLQAIGETLGGKDHTTIIHALTKIEKLIHQDQILADKIELIQKHFYQN